MSELLKKMVEELQDLQELASETGRVTVSVVTIESWLAALAAEPRVTLTEEQVPALRDVMEHAKNLLEECYQADAREESTIDGSFLDAMRDALIRGGNALLSPQSAPTPECTCSGTVEDAYCSIHGAHNDDLPSGEPTQEELAAWAHPDFVKWYNEYAHWDSKEEAYRAWLAARPTQPMPLFVTGEGGLSDIPCPFCGKPECNGYSCAQPAEPAPSESGVDLVEKWEKEKRTHRERGADSRPRLAGAERRWEVNNELELLKRGLRLIGPLVDSHCGNCEGTPCDDMRPSYICAEHKWIKEVRKTLKRERSAKPSGKG
jgi:hypothetical protein